MAKRVCSGIGCHVLVVSGRCPRCARKHEKQRGTRQDRGYDAHHDQLRRLYQDRMNAGETFTCWRPGCGTPIDPNNWTLGHCDTHRDQHHGPECPPCDYATAGRTPGSCPHPSHLSTT